MTESRLHVVKPAAGLGEMFESFAIEGGLHRSAIGVAAEDGMFHLQDFDRIFDGGGGAVDIVARDGDHVARVARTEKIAGAGSQNHIGHNARVGTGDEQGFRRSALRQQVEPTPPGGENFFQEALVALKQAIHSVG